MYDEQSIASLLGNEPASHHDRIGEPTPWSNQKRREVTTEWVVGPGQSSRDEGTIILRLTTYHHGKASYVGERGNEYSSTMRVEFESADGRMRQTTIAFGTKGESVSVHRTGDVARFSAKAMREHHAEALRVVEGERHQIAAILVGGVSRYVAETAA